MFGPGDFLKRLARLARVMPVIPLFGSGETKLQPVYVDDVAAAVTTALATPEAAGKLYELGGPRVYTYKALVQLVLERTGRRRLLLPLPYSLWTALAAIMAPLPQRPISRDQVKLMQKDNVVSADALRSPTLGLSRPPRSGRPELPTPRRPPTALRPSTCRWNSLFAGSLPTPGGCPVMATARSRRPQCELSARCLRLL